MMKQSHNGSVPLKVLFVCVGNACRSQMAEAFTNNLGKGRVEAWSAGTSPLGWIAAGTEDVMAERGIFLSDQWSKGLKDVPIEEMDIIVAMGCEVGFPSPAGFKGRVLEWDVPDPYGRSYEFFQKVRDTIERQVTDLLGEILADEYKAHSKC